MQKFRFLIDENISHFTKKFLIELGYDVKDVYELNLAGADDEEIVKTAIKERRTLITLDNDFGNIYYFSNIGKFGVIIVKLHPPTIENINTILETFLKSDMKNIDLSKDLVILGRKIRVIKGF